MLRRPKHSKIEVVAPKKEEGPRNDTTGVNSMPIHIKDVKNQALHKHITTNTAQETWAGKAQSV
jgi:hypothetical protein